MSSRLRGSSGGGDNEDVEADAAARTEDARPLPEASEQYHGNTLDERDEMERDNGLDLGEPTHDPGLHEDEFGLEDNNHEQQDDLQLEREPPVDISGDIPSDVNPWASPSPSRLESVDDSHSIPDDTPSLQGSRLSSPGPVASPLRRKQVLRTASGALQPFERRFESKSFASPTASLRAASPGFLTPHSRQISLSSQISQASSQDDTDPGEISQAPWDIIKWTKLRKITGQAFSELGRRNFGRPTCMAVSALIAVGTSKGIVLGFDYHQTLKIIIGQGTKATECGSVTALAIAADYSTIVTGHANGHIFTWDISSPARPFLQIPPLDRAILQSGQHPDGHLAGCAILHIGFLGTRHTAIVSADAGGMAFSHIASRGLGPVTRNVNSTRLLGRYPPTDPKLERSRKPSSVLAFSPLPLGNVEKSTDGMGLTAMLTPYLLVIVSTTPVAQTQHKSSRPKEIKPHSTLSGCLAWFPAVKLKHVGADNGTRTSDTKLAYCWSNVLTVLDVKVTEAEDVAKAPSLEFLYRSRWRADEAIVAIQWLGRSVLGVLTISQRLLIVEDGSLQVTDSIDLIHRHIYHQDLYSQQLSSVIERLDSDDPSLHGVVADAFFMSFKAYKGRAFLLGFGDVTVGTLSNWADRLMALMEAGDHVAAIRLAADYYSGVASNVTVGLPDVDGARHEMVKERLIAMISASLAYTFAQQDDGYDTRLRKLTDVCFSAIFTIGDTTYLFEDVYDMFESADEESTFISALEPYILEREVNALPPEVVKTMVAHFISENQAVRLEELLCRLEPSSFDLDQITMLCRQHSLYDALIYVWTRAIGDFVTPLIDLLSLVKLLNDGMDEDVTENPYYESAMKVYPYLAYSLTGRRYPSGEFVDDIEASQSKADLYEYLFAGRATEWPLDSKKIFHPTSSIEGEPAFPYLVLLFEFDIAALMSMLNEAFEDSFLNEADEDGATFARQTNGVDSRGYRMTRDHVLSIMLDAIRQNDFEPEQVIFLDMFIARSLPKYPGQLVLPGSLLNQVLQRLCDPPSETIRDDCQLSVEYLLSAYHPPDMAAVIQALAKAQFYRVLKMVYRSQKMLTKLLETYLDDPADKNGIFETMAFCLHSSLDSNQRQITAVKDTVLQNISSIAAISTVNTARTLAAHAKDLVKPAVDRLTDSYQQFVFLRCLLEPLLLREESKRPKIAAWSEEEQAPFTEQYVQLLCSHDPRHVADYLDSRPTSDLRLDAVLPVMERTGVVDAAVVLLVKDGLVRDAMERLLTHLQSLQHTLASLIDAAADSPDTASTKEAAISLTEDLAKYSKVGMWLCKGQSANAERRPRPRTNFAWEVKEADLDLDEYLWLELIDILVQVSKSTTTALHDLNSKASESGQADLDYSSISTSVHANVQQVFTAVLTATATPNLGQETSSPQTRPVKENLAFLRILRAFLTRAAKSAPSLVDLRTVLSDIFSAYTFEQGVLSLVNELLGSDVFVDINRAHELRQRGWRPRTQVCEHCKRRAWGPGIGETLWDQWIAKEQQRDADRTRTNIERGGGEEARRLSRGKAKAKASPTPGVADQKVVEEHKERKLELVVFACRHVFHRACLEPNFKDGRPTNAQGEAYKCLLCNE
nr:isoform 3 of vacuolar protein sorting-associated protein 8 like [Quercus suber]